jgi:hypothetical protein
MLPDLEAAVVELADSDDVAEIVVVGSAAARLDQMEACRPALQRVLDRHGKDGTNLLVVSSRFLLCLNAVVRGDWSEADRIVDDARGLAGTDNLNGWLVESEAGVLAARQGRSTGVSRACTVLAERGLRPAGRLAQAFHDVVRAEDALGRAEWRRGYELLRGVMPVDDPFGEFTMVPFLTLNFAEAAWHAGRTAEARAHVAAMQAAGCTELSTRAALITVGAQGVVAPTTSRPPGCSSARWPTPMRSAGRGNSRGYSSRTGAGCAVVGTRERRGPRSPRRGRPSSGWERCRGSSRPRSS